MLRERSESVVNSARRAWTELEVRWLLVAGLAAFVLYQVSLEPGSQVYNQYVRLADSFLHGRVDIMDPAPWLEGAFFEGRFYSHQGVLPAVLLLPFVALFGSDFEMRHFAALLGAGISMAAWVLATRIGLNGWTRVAGWALPVMGTTIWFEAKAGSTWGVAALASVLFLFLALAEYFGKRRFWLVGLCVGLAAASRPSAILALIGFALVARNPRKIVQLGLGVAGPVLLILSYNFLRFGTIMDRSQELHYIQDSFRHQRPPGQFSLAHVPFNLYSWFLMTPDFQSSFPYLRLTIMGTALPLTSPAFVTTLGAKRERWLWLCAICVVGPAALHYANGFAQFGMRYLLDAVPFLSALVFVALRDGRGPGYRALLAASVVINAYGVAYTSVYGLQL